MRILIHDYGGYSFTIQISRELALRGHDILYLYGDSTQLVKRAAFQPKLGDSDTFKSAGIKLSRPFQKYSLIKRRKQEIEYGKLLANQIKLFHPEVVFSANTPLDAQSIALKTTKEIDGRFVFWLQDAIGIATRKILKKKNAILAELIGRYYISLERKLVKQSSAVVIISEDFRSLMDKWLVDPRKIYVIQNWAPLNEIMPRPKRNPWAKKFGLENKFCFLYTGVLGMKHNPELFVRMAYQWQGHDDVRIVVVSEGSGADWLKMEVENKSLKNLMIIDFQPFECYPDVLGSGDVLIAILDEDAGVYSVPSKVLSYLCAERPVLLAVPPKNLAARIVSQNQTGLTVRPIDVGGFINAAETLYLNSELRTMSSTNGRKFAQHNFDILNIVQKFEKILTNITRTE